jgi:hypothetical protein
MVSILTRSQRRRRDDGSSVSGKAKGEPPLRNAPGSQAGKDLAIASAISALCVSKATMLETIATIQKAMIIHEEGRTARRPRVLTDERG